MYFLLKLGIVHCCWWFTNRTWKMNTSPVPTLERSCLAAVWQPFGARWTHISFPRPLDSVFQPSGIVGVFHLFLLRTNSICPQKQLRIPQSLWRWQTATYAHHEPSPPMAGEKGRLAEKSTRKLLQVGWLAMIIHKHSWHSWHFSGSRFCSKKCSRFQG